MVLTKSILQKELNKIYKFLKDGHSIEFKKLKTQRGYILLQDMKPARIVLDHREELFATIIHEILHYVHPEFTEDDVLEMERLMINLMTPRQVKNLLTRFVAAL